MSPNRPHHIAGCSVLGFTKPELAKRSGLDLNLRNPRPGVLSLNDPRLYDECSINKVF